MMGRAALWLTLICAGLLLAACLAPAQLTPVSPEAAGLTWRECPVPFGDPPWPQVEACLGGLLWPVWDETDRANAGEQPEYNVHRLRVAADVFETHEIAAFFSSSVYLLTKNGWPIRTYLGEFSTYSPNLGLYNLTGQVAWHFDDGRTSTVFFGGKDLRKVYAADAVYAPYALRGKLIVIARRSSAYTVIYDGQQVGPSFDAITIAYCCEPAMYSARGGGGQYVFWGERGGQRYVVRVSSAG